jgi:hypothetical protein
MNTPDNHLSFLKKLFWLYFLLLIFEGALRKWIFPGAANVLLLVRDPVVIVLYIAAMGKGVFPSSAMMWIGVLLGMVSLAAGLMVENNQLSVALFGWRANFLHLPLIFLTPKIFTYEDVAKLGRWTVLIAGPMTVLVVIQFISPTSSFINLSIGGGEGNMMAGGHVRPPGTFSFTTGMASFCGLLSCFVFWPMGGGRGYGRMLNLLGLIALGISVCVSGSRSTVAEVLLAFMGLLAVWSFQGKLVGQVMKYFPIVIAAIFILSYVSFVGSGVEVLNDRFSEGGPSDLFGRIIYQFAAPFSFIDTVPFLGYGLGMGTSAGAVLRSGTREFLLAEGEWSRIVLESGMVLGLSFLFYRVAISILLIQTALQALGRNNNMAPAFCLVGAMHIAMDQFGQATALGFSVLIAGLGLAAGQGSLILPDPPPVPPVPVKKPARRFLGLRKPPSPLPLVAVVEDKPPLLPVPDSSVPAGRGRSVYARRLHGDPAPRP